MTIYIKELDEGSIKDVYRVDGVFTIDSRLHLHMNDDELTYIKEEVSPYEKRYEVDERDLETYITDPDKIIYLAYSDYQVAGQIIIRKHWNNYAYIEDLTVDTAYRNQGIGKELLEWVKNWARAKQLPGIMLETQNNNVAACSLYEKCGFILGGFDTYLYKGLKPDTDEIALYWYYFFD